MTSDLELEKKKHVETQQKLKEEKDGNNSIQEQSINQIRSLGEENQRLKAELDSVRSELTALKKQRVPQPDVNPVLQSLSTENEQLRSYVNVLQKQLTEAEQRVLSKEQPRKLSDPPPPPTLDQNLDIEHMDEKQLRHQLTSEHAQLEAVTSYLRDMEDVINQDLRQFLPLDTQPADCAATHEKLEFLLQHAHFQPPSDEMEELRQVAETNYKCSESWRIEAERAQEEVNSLQACISCIEAYLKRLVGAEAAPEHDLQTWLQMRLELVCARSQKLMNEYRALRALVDGGKTIDATSISRLFQQTQQLGEHLGILARGSTPTWRELEEVLRRVDAIVVEQLPQVATCIRQLRDRATRESEKRRQLEERLQRFERSVH